MNDQLKTFSEIQDVECEATFHIEGIGDVTFPRGVYQVSAVAKIPAIRDIVPEDLAIVQQAAQIAISAINQTYTPEISAKIIANLGISSVNTGLTIPVTIIRSKDFFQDRLTIIPRPELLNFSSNLSDKTAALNFIKNNPLSSNQDFLVDVEALIEQEQAVIEDKKQNTANKVFAAPSGTIIPAPFTSSDVVTVAGQCCDPIEERPTEVEFPILEDPITISEEEINRILDVVESVSQQMATCASERAEAELYIQKLRKIKEDLYTVSYFFKERYNSLLQYETILSVQNDIVSVFNDNANLVSKIRSEAEKIFGKTTVSSTLNAATIPTTGADSIDILQKTYSALYSLATIKNSGTITDMSKKTYLSSIQSYADSYQKNVSTIATLQKNVQRSQSEIVLASALDDNSTKTLLSGNSFDLSSYLRRDILYPSGSTNTNQYSNQSGIIDKGNYFLFINEDTPISDEIESMFSKGLSASSLKGFIQKTSNPVASLKKYAKLQAGKLYGDFYDKLNSPDRTDFLFTYQEQGYLAPKPSAAELLTQAGQDRLKDFKIDEGKASNFLKNYAVLEEARILEKLNTLKTDNVSFFAQVQTQAKLEAERIYEIESTFYFYTMFDRAKIVKTFRDLIKDEYQTVLNFEKEIDNKILALKDISALKLKCLTDQENILQSLSTTPDASTDIDPVPGSDPYGSKPISIDNPNMYKKHYWDEYTKCLQTVSFMPIPDLMSLRKRLFRYYPVGLRIPVPTPPGVLPTLASGIPDRNISIPFPILWKNILNLTTPVGTFVLWITYCAPFTFAPYMMYFDEEFRGVFLTSPRGKVDVPAPSLKWNNDSVLNKALIERIPNLKIPMSSLPQVDNVTSNKHPDDKKGSINEMRSRIKSTIDHLDSNTAVLSSQRIADRSKLKKYRDKIKSTLDIDKGVIDVEAIKEFLGVIKDIVKRKTTQMIDFESFSVPKTQSKTAGINSPLKDFNNQLSKIKSLAKNSVNVTTKTVDISKIMKDKTTRFLDTPKGKKQIEDLQTRLNELNTTLQKQNIHDVSIIKQERAKEVLSDLKKLLSKTADSITPKTLGFVQSPISLEPAFLPFPCKSNFSFTPAPIWISVAIAGIKAATSILDTPEFQNRFAKDLDLKIGIGSSAPPNARDLLYQSIASGVDITLGSVPSTVPGWPNKIVYPDSVSLLSQNVKELKNSIWKIRFSVNTGGIPPITISPDMIRSVANPLVDASIDIIFSQIINKLVALSLEQSSPSSIINLKHTVKTVNAVFGNDIWDLNEQDLKILATAFVRDSLIKVDKFLEITLSQVDYAKKVSTSFFDKLAPFSLQKSKAQYQPSLDIGTQVGSALFKQFTAKYVSGELPAPPPPAVLLACSTGLPGWITMTSVDPFRAIEKIPPYERISLKNVPYVIFLDMIAASAQRMGGIGSNYVIPYSTPEN